MYDHYKSSGAEDQYQNSWHHPVNYQIAAKQISITPLNANHAVHYWVKLGWLTNNPPPALQRSGVSIKISSNDFFFTDAGERKAREVLEAESNPPATRNMASPWRAVISVGLAVILFLLLIGAFVFYPKPTADQRLLIRLIASLLAGVLGIAITGSVATNIEIPMPRGGKHVIQATGGAAFFIIIWLSWPTTISSN